jgi:hypothetical protein
LFGDRRGFKPAQLKTNKQTDDQMIRSKNLTWWTSLGIAMI